MQKCCKFIISFLFFADMKRQHQSCQPTVSALLIGSKDFTELRFLSKFCHSTSRNHFPFFQVQFSIYLCRHAIKSEFLINISSIVNFIFKSQIFDITKQDFLEMSDQENREIFLYKIAHNICIPSISHISSGKHHRCLSREVTFSLPK